MEFKLRFAYFLLGFTLMHTIVTIGYSLLCPTVGERTEGWTHSILNLVAMVVITFLIERNKL